MKLWKRRDGSSTNGDNAVSEYYDPESAVATELRRLIQRIRQAQPPLKSVLITSAVAGEGKSLLASHLAVTLAHQYIQETILLLDADLRRPRQHELLNVERKPGVSEVFSGQLPSELAMHATRLPNLKIMPSGHRKHSPAELWESAEFPARLKELGKEASTIVMDAPPIIPVTDVSLIAPHVDGVLMVVHAGKTYREVVQRGIEVLKDSDARLVGLVLNNIQKVLPYYYDYSYYNYRGKNEAQETHDPEELE